MTCRIENCEFVVDAKGLCHGHYQRLLRIGTPGTTLLRRGRRSCSVESCDRQHKAKGLCDVHYKRFVQHGNPLADVPIRVATGRGANSHGYLNIPVPSELRRLTNGAPWVAEHRLVMAKHLSRPLRSEESVHHINGDRSDNRIENLELWATSHPSGQRVLDLVEFAQVILEQYGDELDLLVRG